MKLLQDELAEVTKHVKEKDQEYRLNELKIKELRRQLPSKVLKPIDHQKALMMNRDLSGNRMSVPQLPA